RSTPPAEPSGRRTPPARISTKISTPAGTIFATSRRQRSDDGDVVHRAVRPPRSQQAPGGPRPPLQREAIVPVRDRLRSVVAELLRGPDLTAQGAALASLMVWDSASP